MMKRLAHVTDVTLKPVTNLSRLSDRPRRPSPIRSGNFLGEAWESHLLKTHPGEDLETALKALEIAEGSLEEVVERYE
jgi:hypothetical protein